MIQPAQNLASLADAFEMFRYNGTSLSVNFENDRLTEIRQGETSGLAIRAVKQGKIGFSYSSKDGELDQVAEAAVRMAPYGKPYTFDFAERQESQATKSFDPRCANLSVERLVQLGLRVRDVVKQHVPEALAEFYAGGSAGTTRIATHRGQDCAEQESGFSYAVSVKMAEEGNFLYTYRYRSSGEVIDDAEIIAQAERASRDFLDARRTAPLKAGTYRVLFSPTALGDILTTISASVNGLSIEKKTSRFVNSLGETLFDKRLTLIDDPHAEDGPGGGRYDGEGVVTKKRAIVEHGVLKGFVHTLATARNCGHEPTGNAKRGLSTTPQPGLHNLVMAPGEDSLESLIAQADGGLWIDQMLGTFTSNFLAGQVSGNISLGYAVNEGRRVGRVKNCALNVNGFDLLKSRIVGISREREWAGSSFLPWVLFDGVAISAR
jgi:PmbA protein